MKMIAAVDLNWGIGSNNKLLFHIPNDMSLFKILTKDAGIVVMGRKTFESMNCRPLPNRTNIIISSKDIVCKSTSETPVLTFKNIFDTLDYIDSNHLSDKTFIIGGGTIYKEFEKYCIKAYITKIKYNAEGVDTYFPNLDEMKNWRLFVASEENTYNDLKYTFVQYANTNVCHFEIDD